MVLSALVKDVKDAMYPFDSMWEGPVTRIIIWLQSLKSTGSEVMGKLHPSLSTAA